MEELAGEPEKGPSVYLYGTKGKATAQLKEKRNKGHVLPLRTTNASGCRRLQGVVFAKACMRETQNETRAGAA